MILDEVDSMLLDNGGHITKLATPFPGMDYLKYAYMKIWQELLQFADEYPAKAQKKIEVKREELKDDPEKFSKLIEFSQELDTHFEDDMRKAIKASEPHKIGLIPPHLRDFAGQMLDKWIKNAMHARYGCHENVNYVIRPNDDGEDQIVPVDFINTGVTLKNTVWSDGLHQFVQLKHNLQVTTETLTSSFISNIGYLKLYGHNLIGLTGEVGSHTND
jgi:preprotein translocase subunit SecA